MGRLGICSGDKQDGGQAGVVLSSANLYHSSLSCLTHAQYSFTTINTDPVLWGGDVTRRRLSWQNGGLNSVRCGQ